MNSWFPTHKGAQVTNPLLQNISQMRVQSAEIPRYGDFIFSPIADEPTERRLCVFACACVCAGLPTRPSPGQAKYCTQLLLRHSTLLSRRLACSNASTGRDQRNTRPQQTNTTTLILWEGTLGAGKVVQAVMQPVSVSCLTFKFC